MLNTKKLQGFTLIELLIVLAVIATLSTLTVVYLDGSRMASRDSRRIADVKQLQLALKMYYNDLGYYPTVITAGEPIANGSVVYMSKVPSNPAPRTDNGCPDQDYQYIQIEDGGRYSLTFCLGDKIDDLDFGTRVATHNGILNCPENWLAIPGSKELHTNDFCVMKYEAKCALAATPNVGLTNDPTSANTYNNSASPCTSANAKTIASVASGYPIANITQEEAKTYCQAIGARLINNAEWTTIIRNGEKLYSDDIEISNWSEGSVGDGYMPSGISSGAQADEAFNEWHNIYHTPQVRRTLYLTTGQKIWDLAGDVSEWVDATCQSGEGAEKYDSSDTTWDGVNLEEERVVAGPSDPTFSGHGIGVYFGCSQNNNVLIRGGNAGGTTFPDTAGVYNLYMHGDITSDILLGFRCVK